MSSQSVKHVACAQKFTRCVWHINPRGRAIAEMPHFRTTQAACMLFLKPTSVWAPAPLFPHKRGPNGKGTLLTLKGFSGNSFAHLRQIRGGENTVIKCKNIFWPLIRAPPVRGRLFLITPAPSRRSRNVNLNNIIPSQDGSSMTCLLYTSPSPRD